MFDWMLFLKIVCWLFAIGGTLWGILLAAIFYHENFTEHGRLVVLVQQLKGYQTVYPLKPILIAIVAWIAIFCF